MNFWLGIFKGEIVWTKYIWGVWYTSHKPAVMQALWAVSILSWFPVPLKLFPLRFKWMWFVTLVGLKKTVVNKITCITMVTLQIEYDYLTIHCKLITIPVYVVARVFTAFVEIYCVFRNTTCISKHITVFCEPNCIKHQQVTITTYIHWPISLQHKYTKDYPVSFFDLDIRMT